MKIFLSSNPSTFSQLEGEARKDTQDSDIFNHNHTMQASQQQLKKWVNSTWNNVSELTELRRLAQVVTGTKTSTTTSAVQIYGDSISRINSLLGRDYTIVTSVVPLDDHTVIRAKVNISYLLAISRFDDSN